MCHSSFVGNFDHHIFNCHSPRDLDLLDGIWHLTEDSQLLPKKEPDSDTVKVDQNLSVEFEDGGVNCELVKLRDENSKLKEEFNKVREEIKELKEQRSSLKESYDTLQMLTNSKLKKMRKMKSDVFKVVNQLRFRESIHTLNGPKERTKTEVKDWKVLIASDAHIKLKRLNVPQSISL